jgi:hypothetical protein
MITPAEITRRVNTSRQAVHKWLLEQEKKSGLKPIEVKGNKKYYDEKNPLIKRYLAQAGKRGKKNGSPCIDPADEKSEAGDEYTETPPKRAGKAGGDYASWELARMREWALKLELDNQIKRNEYLRRDFVRQFLGQLATVFTGIIQPMGSKLSSELAVIYGNKTPEKIIAAQKKIDGETYEAAALINKKIDDFLIAAEKQK